MKAVIDAFWRAAAYCLHPRVILLSLLPLVLASALGVGLAWLFWEDAINAVRDSLEQWPALAPLVAWLNDMTAGAFRSVIGPLVVVSAAIPVLLILSLLLVGALMGPALVNLVAMRRFPALQRRRGTSWGATVAMSAGAAALALVALAISLPLWLIPPLALLLPPLIWGWLSYRVMSLDALSDHADTDERRAVMREHRPRLFGMGVVTGYLGVAPSMVWALSSMALPMAPLLIPLFVWLYTLVFAFSALWFIHYCLTALNVRRARAVPPPQEAPHPGAPELPPEARLPAAQLPPAPAPGVPP